MNTLSDALRLAHRPTGPLSALTEDARQLLDVLPQSLLLLDRGEHIAFVNRAAALLLGLPAHQLLGRSWREAISLTPAEESGLHFAWNREDDGPAPEEAIFLLTRGDGGQRIVQLGDAAVPAGILASRVVLLQDCTLAWDRVRQLKHHCSRDHLTNLVNRREFEHRLERVVRRVRQDGSDSVLAFMDLDCFKAVNDAHGHTAGDHVLREVAALLAKSVRGRDTLARLGGDEFGLLMEHCSALEAVKAGSMLQELIGRHRFEWQGHELRIGISIGMTMIDRSNAEDKELLAQADSACYVAKNDPAIKVQLYDAPEHVRAAGARRRKPICAVGSTRRYDSG